MIKIGDYNTIMNDRNIFNQIVYTPLSEALRLLDERQKDPELMTKVDELLNGDIPEIFNKVGKYGVQFRQVTTPNNDCKYFVKLAKENNLTPVFFEYHDDKFTSNNLFKHSLGQLRVQGNVNKNDKYTTKKITIVDFSKFDGKKLKDVHTLWDEPLVNFHKKLFNARNYNLDDFIFFNASTWLKNNGGDATNYYIKFLLLFMCHGILFENFLITKDSEGGFSEKIILPAIEKIINLLGIKPLIVPTNPLDLETDEHWISYHEDTEKLIPKI